MHESNADFKKLLGVIDVITAGHVLASATVANPLRALLPLEIRVHDLAALEAIGARLDERFVCGATVAPTDVLFYQLTSGSTGTP
eukprot:1315585-Prymnesium_polylepis.1